MLDSIARRMLYPAPPIRVPSPPPAPLEEVTLELSAAGVSTGRAVAWAGERPRAQSPAILFFHGNGENLETVRRSGLFDQLAGLGAHFLAVDYPGYGRSSGRPSEASLTAAGEAGLAWLTARFPRSPKIVLGWSLGAAVAIRTAAAGSGRIDGLGLLSAWADLPSLAAVHFPSWLVRLGLSDTYDSVAVAEQIRGPVLQLHGSRDRIIPIAQGRRLHSALQRASRHGGGMGVGPRFVEVPGAGHNDLLSHKIVWDELAGLLRH